MKRKLKIDLADLAMAFENASLESQSYLDQETGEVVLVTDETRREVEDIYEELADAQREAPAAFAAALAERDDLHDWIKEAVQRAHEVEVGYGTRFVAVPQADSREGYRDMEDFIDTVADNHLQELLSVAIQGQGAFRRFKDVLLNYPRERERWFKFKDTCLRQRVVDWLESIGIEAE
jgi:hypothetical protein